MSKLLPISQLGNPILRQQAQPIDDVQDERIQTLIDNLLATLLQTSGVGIAAPQAAASCQLLIVASHPNARYPDAPYIEPIAMINPQIVAHSDQQVKGWEGCLSVPGIRGLVPRYSAIAVTYTDRQGKSQQQDLMDFIARIFQHEYDHLNGILFVDRVESTHDLFTEQEYQRQIAQNLPPG